MAASYVFPSFDRLPRPDQVVEMIGKTAPISSSQRGTKNLTLNVPK